VRKNKGLLHTVCWLPRHMTPAELGVLTELAAVRYLLSTPGQEDLLETLGPQDRAKILEQAGIRERTLVGQLEDLLKEVYVHHGEFVALISDVDSSRPRETLSENLEHIATLLMDRRYPQHPTFLAEPKKQDLEALLKWMVDAGETNVSVAYDDTTGKVLRTLGQPLELVNLGQTKAMLRLDSRYIKDVLQRTDQDSVAWMPIADHLRENFGFQPLVTDLFLCFLCQRDHRALQEIDGEAVEVRIGMAPTARLRLQRGKLVGAAEWHRLRDLGNQLFNLERPMAHRSLQGQDRFAAKLKESGQAKRTVLQHLHERLVKLGVDSGERLKELAEANARLAALGQPTSDSHKVLTELLSVWPDNTADPVRSIVHEADSISAALGELNEHARANLSAGTQHGAFGAEVREHLGTLASRLAGAQAAQPLTKVWVQSWNAKAQDLTRKLIEQPTPTPIPVPLPPPLPARVVLCKARLNPGDAAAVSSFMKEVGKALSKAGSGSISLKLIQEEDSE
jgi:hypothetical protein